MSSTTCKELEVWKRSKDLAVKIYNLNNQPEFSKDYTLKDQIRRSSISIPSNIAEGNGRESLKDYMRFLYIARGSLNELRTQLVIAYEVNYIKKLEYDSVDRECEEISRMLSGLIKALSRKT